MNVGIFDHRDFSTPEMDKIELLGKEEFKASAPGTLLAVPEEENPHVFQMNRVCCLLPHLPFTAAYALHFAS